MNDPDNASKYTVALEDLEAEAHVLVEDQATAQAIVVTPATASDWDRDRRQAGLAGGG